MEQVSKFQEEIAQQYPEEHEDSIAEIALSANLRVSYWSAGAEKLFGYQAEDTLHNSLDSLGFAISDDFLQQQLDFMQSQLSGCPEMVMSLNGSAPFIVDSLNGTLNVAIRLALLSHADRTIPLLLFYKTKRKVNATNKEAKIDLPDGDTVVDSFFAWAYFLWNQSIAGKLLLAICVIVLTAYITVDRIDSITKFIDKLPKTAPVVAKIPFFVPEAKRLKIKGTLDVIRNSYPDPELLRVYLGFYQKESGTYYYSIPEGLESTDMSRLSSGQYLIKTNSLAAERMDTHRKGHCYIIETDTANQSDPLISTFRSNFATKEISCGFELDKHLEVPVIGFIAIQSVDTDTPIGALGENLIKWIEKIQKQLDSE